MDVERETIVEAAAAAVGVGLFIAVALVVGARYSSNHLSPTGALALVGGIVAFVAAMTVIGFWLSTRG